MPNHSLSTLLRRQMVLLGISSGRCLQRLGINGKRIDAEALIDKAQRQADFNQWGSPDPYAPLNLLCNDLEKNAHLHLPGRVATQFDLLRLLTNRLAIEKRIHNQPAIAEEPVISPIFVIGLPRTGTTLLHNLLAQDPLHRAPLIWETMQPMQAHAEVKHLHAKSRRHVDNQLRWLDGIAPEFHRMHAVQADVAQECLVINAHALHSYQFQTTHYVPEYQAWLDTISHVEAYQYHRRFLQHLQFGDAPGHWVLKAPAHLFSLDDLLRVYPDACIIQTHREPGEAMSSLASLSAALRRAFSDRVDDIAVAREMTERWSNALHTAMAARDGEHVNSDRVVDVHYTELVNDPLAVVRQIYQYFGRELTTDAAACMQDYMHNHPKDAHGKHHHKLADYNMNVTDINASFAEYRNRFFPASDVSYAA